MAWLRYRWLQFRQSQNCLNHPTMTDALIISYSTNDLCLWHATKQPLIIHQPLENILSTGGESGISLSCTQGRDFSSVVRTCRICLFPQKQSSWHQKSNQTWNHDFFYSLASKLEGRNKLKYKIRFCLSLNSIFLPFWSKQGDVN